MLAALLAMALAAPSATPDPAALARSVQGFYEKTRDLEADFVQIYTYAAFGRTQTSRGVLRVKKPGKLRWDYSEPAPKTIVVNGTRLVQYEPEANQAYVDDHFDATAMSAAVTFLLGKGSLEKEFELGADAEGRLVLTPRKPDARVERVVLTVGASGEVVATRVVDGSGNVNEIAFRKLRRNVGLADDAFVLDLPRDVHRVKVPGGG
jgi:outer membrane lipoprotein carrier protein